MIDNGHLNEDPRVQRRQLLESALAYIAFCSLGIASRFFPPVFLLFLLFGLVFPLVWARFTKNWEAIGFTKRNRDKALFWGACAGIVWALYTYTVFREDKALPPLWPVQVLIAFPVWFLLMSPFQEFFFRDWLQPRLQAVMGKWPGLIVISLAFTLWHFFPQLEGTLTTTLPLSSAVGVISTFLAGLLFGYIHQRAENILAPWLAHAIGGIGLVLIGEMTFIQYVP